MRQAQLQGLSCLAHDPDMKRACQRLEDKNPEIDLFTSRDQLIYFRTLLVALKSTKRQQLMNILANLQLFLFNLEMSRSVGIVDRLVCNEKPKKERQKEKERGRNISFQ